MRKFLVLVESREQGDEKILDPISSYICCGVSFFNQGQHYYHFSLIK